tara:strand:+ start:66 stop:278 length:213 start_codon:yes stop_codon:yes gene_type:complete
MSEPQRLKFTIRQDGTVNEEVIGVIGNQCQEITKAIEEKLGNVIYTEPKPEYYKQNVTLQHNQNENQEQT